MIRPPMARRIQVLGSGMTEIEPSARKVVVSHNRALPRAESWRSEAYVKCGSIQSACPFKKFKLVAECGTEVQ